MGMGMKGDEKRVKKKDKGSGKYISTLPIHQGYLQHP